MADFENHIRYQDVFRQLPGNFLLMLPNGTILDNSDQHEQSGMKKRNEVIGKTIFEAYPTGSESQAEEIRQSYEQVKKHLQPHTMPVIRYDLEQEDGLEEMYWQAAHYPVLNEQGELLYILQKTENVTARIRAEQERKHIEAALEESHERSRFVLEALPVMVWTAKADGTPEYTNSRWAIFRGKNPLEETEWDWASEIHPDDRQMVIERWEQALALGTDFQAEYRLKRSDGQYRWVLMKGVPRLDAKGNVTMWVGSGMEVHETREMVQELLESNEHQAMLSDQVQEAYRMAELHREMFYQLFMEAPAAITLLKGPQHLFDFVNPGYQQLFPGRQLQGKTVAEALPEVVEQGFIDILDQVYQTGQSYYGTEMEIMLDRSGTGQLQACYFNFTYQQYKEGDKVAGVAVFAFDVTSFVEARKKADPGSSGSVAPH